MRWPWVALSCVVAQEFVGFKKLSSRNQAQCIVVHVSFILQAFFFCPFYVYMANNFIQHGRRACELCHLLDFPNLVKNCPFAPQPSIYLHVPKYSSQKGCMNFSLNSVFFKYTANSDFPTPLKLCPFSTTSAIHLFKNSTWLCRRTGKKQVPSCSCLRSPNRIRITRCRTSF